jgi:hypothetical protein
MEVVWTGPRQALPEMKGRGEGPGRGKLFPGRRGGGKDHSRQALPEMKGNE